MKRYPSTIQNAIDHFAKLPGIGPKTAQRMVFYLLKQSKDDLQAFSQSISKLKEGLKTCSTCQTISEQDPCEICSNKSRNQKQICVVAEPSDITTIESTGEYKGLYHVLGGTINTLTGVTPDKLKVKELAERINKQKPDEIIFALNPDLEGETTIIYLAKLLKPAKIKLTRLAKGLPMGSDLEYADEVTLESALRGRTVV